MRTGVLGGNGLANSSDGAVSVDSGDSHSCDCCFSSAVGRDYYNSMDVGPSALVSLTFPLKKKKRKW